MNKPKYLRMSLIDVITNHDKALARQARALKRGFVGIKLGGYFRKPEPRPDLVTEDMDEAEKDFCTNIDDIADIASLCTGRTSASCQLMLYTKRRLSIQSGKEATVRGRLETSQDGIITLLLVDDIKVGKTIYVCKSEN